MALPRLIYFEMRGRAEAIRLLLHATETRFDDHRVVERDEWAALEPELPFGGLPIYRSSSGLLCESHAILRYLGRVLTGPPQDEFAAAELDAVYEAIAESQEDLWRFNWSESYYDHLDSYAQGTLQPRLSRLQGWFASRSATQDGFGPKPSHVHCLAFCYLDEIDAFFPAVLAQFPALAELRTRIASFPGISAYLESGARPIVFGMGRMGPKVDPRVAIPPQCTFPNPWTKPIDLVRVKRLQRRLTSCS